MSIPNDNSPLARLRHHVTGAIERGEATPIVGQPSPGAVEQALKALIDAYIDTRGCSRLVAAGFAAKAARDEYEAISGRVSQ